MPESPKRFRNTELAHKPFLLNPTSQLRLLHPRRFGDEKASCSLLATLVGPIKVRQSDALFVILCLVPPLIFSLVFISLAKADIAINRLDLQLPSH